MPALRFIRALLKHWWFVVSSAIFTGLGLYATALGRSGEWYVKAAFILAVIAFFIATYLAWKEQYDKAAAETPNFVLEVHGVFSQATEGKTLVILSLRIVNKGAPSAVLGYKVHYVGPGLDQFAQLLYVKNVDGTDEVSFRMANGSLFTVRGSDAIYDRTTEPIPRGGFVAGRLPVLVDGERHHDIASGAARLIVTITDYTKRDTVTEFVGAGNNEIPTYLLGEPISDKNVSMIVSVPKQRPSKRERRRSRRNR